MDLRNEIVSVIKNEVLGSGKEELFREPLVGFASADDPLFSKLAEIVGPEHVHPKDILESAKTVVAFFVPFSKRIVLENRKSPEVSPEWANIYLVANALINDISKKLIEHLAGKGIEGGTIKATHTFDEKTLQAGWSHRSAAYIAGLGRFGLNRMLITPVGCAGRYGSVVISEKIAPDPRPQEELCTYFINGQCGFCINNCPTQALKVDGFDRHKCYAHLLEVSKRFSDLGGLCDVCGKCVVGPCAILFDKSKERSL
ncbi:epoxyqueuosine reductase [Candidatus Formimonas warabiya]|uniref:epoxyqueuosine reductase n=1 Tax=Formimonas warabiya TaxID=1761012 RepID=UPI0011D12C21|nr:epoxyqueuosine reductase [Candidatus Formimonas warabiya]